MFVAERVFEWLRGLDADLAETTAILTNALTADDLRSGQYPSSIPISHDLGSSSINAGHIFFGVILPRLVIGNWDSCMPTAPSAPAVLPRNASPRFGQLDQGHLSVFLLLLAFSCGFIKSTTAQGDCRLIVPLLLSLCLIKAVSIGPWQCTKSRRLIVA